MCKVFTGCNVENASYSLTTCAERVALQSAVCAGEREFVAIAIVAGGDCPPRPCGPCLQALAEFSPGMSLLLATTGGAVERRLLSDLLPEPFTLAAGGEAARARAGDRPQPGGTTGAGRTPGAGGQA